VSLEPPFTDVERARRGDAAAFEALYRAQAGRVYALCLRMSGDARDAEELTQDVFVRAWEKLPQFRGESGVGTWLHRLAVNVVLERSRRDRRRLARVDVRSDERLARLGQAAPGASVEERLTLEEAVAALPPAVRAVFVLHDVEGYKHDEIAKLTGRAAGTLRAQLHRARKLLLEALR
jgi:RNA polymerase sigma-70 factor (ECF subfamily)